MDPSAGPQTTWADAAKTYVLEKVARYESGLERSLFKNLHELQRLQAVRSPTRPNPILFTVLVTIQSGDPMPFADVHGRARERT